MIGWKDEGNASDGVVNGIDESVWSVERNGGICPPPPRRNEGDVGKNGEIYPLHQIGVGKSGLAGPPRRIESDVDDVSSRCFSASPPPLHHPYASSDGSYLSRGPSLDPNREKTHPSTSSPSRP